MRKLLSLLVIVLAGCGGATGLSPTGGGPSVAASAAGAASPGASSNPSSGASPASSGGPSAAAAALPDACAKGLAAYLVAIQPLVSGFDGGKATLGALRSADDAVAEKSIELLTANNSKAPYSCPEVGLEWAYFDASSPWDAVLAVAGSAAPGTAAYLTAKRAWANLDVAVVGDYGVQGCDAAVAKIKKGVAEQTAGGKAGVDKMGLKDGLALLGLYRAYLHDVQAGKCPRDALGNAETNFFGAMG